MSVKSAVALAVCGLVVLLFSVIVWPNPYRATASTPTGIEGTNPFFPQVRIGNPSLAGNTGMSPPIALLHPRPQYTQEALNAGIEGTVTVRGEFDIDGKLQVLGVVNGLGFGLDESALAALERWQFRPAYRNGRRVRAVANIDVEFRLPRVFSVGGGVTMPVVTYRVDPQYSEMAREARFEGTAVLAAIVHKDGTVTIERVVRGLGFGLDQKAIEAVLQWTFRPAMRDGEPVDVALNVEVNFNLR